MPAMGILHTRNGITCHSSSRTVWKLVAVMTPALYLYGPSNAWHFCANELPIQMAHKKAPHCTACQSSATDGLEEVVRPDLYVALGVEQNATGDQIKVAYRQAMRTLHPDLDHANPDEAQAMFNEVAEAYRVLSDPTKRQAYDLRGLAGLAEMEFKGDRVITPPPWRVRVGHTSHHFWKREEYFIGLLAETIDLPIHDIKCAYHEATKDPPGVGQAMLVKECTERRAKDIVEALGEFGIICLAEEVPEGERNDASH